jgi:hypothetical protein
MHRWIIETALTAIVAALVGLVFALMLLSRPALAEAAPQCAPWPTLAEELAARYRERVLFEGVLPGGPPAPRLIITAAADGTTWTALIVDTSGRACMRGFGGGWRAGPAPVAPGTPG